MELKGYKLSTNYSLLWDIIHEGYTIVGYIFYDEEWVLIEIKFNTFTGNYYLGGYENSEFATELNSFRADCEEMKIKYILAKMEDGGNND